MAEPTSSPAIAVRRSLLCPRLSLWRELARQGWLPAMLIVLALLALPQARGMDVGPTAPNTWSLAAAMTQARQGQTATLLPTGQVLVAGGCGYPYCINLASAELYDPPTNTWSQTGSMAVGHAGHTATLLSNGQVLVTGGFTTTAELYDPTAGTWSPTGSMAVARQNQTATLLPNGQVLIAGGCCDSNLNALASAELYDPTTGAFTPTGNMSVPRQYQTATLLPNGKVLVAGGCCDSRHAMLASAELYDPASGIWTPTGNMTLPRAYQTATLLPNGLVLMVGGCCDGSGNALASAELYNPATGTWSLTGSMVAGRQSHTATLLPSGQVLVAGGSSANSALGSAELYDPSSGTWTASGGLITPRQGQTATLLPSGQVLVAGGQDINGVALATTELYTPGTGPLLQLSQNSLALGAIRVGASSVTQTITLTNTGTSPVAISSLAISGVASLELSSTSACTVAPLLPGASCALALQLAPTVTGARNATVTISSTAPASPQSLPVSGFGAGPDTWTPMRPMNVPRQNQTATLLPSGKVLVVGGCCGNGDTLLSSAQLFDPTTGFWTFTGGMSTPRQNHTATVLPNGKVLVAGGCADNYCGVGLASAELYDPSTGMFTPTGSMTVPRRYHTATLLPSGQVLIAGGCCDGAGNVLSSAELYDPSTGTFTPTGSMNVPRQFHTATLLTSGPLSGTVLAAGGDCCGQPSSAELYHPNTGTWTLTGAMNATRRYHTATLLPNGQVLIAGGCCSLASAELYDPSTGTFTPTGSMNVPREYHTATLLPSGKVLVAGGCCILSSAELYDPSTGAWTLTGALTTGRQNHTATLLKTGQVLLTGGCCSAAGFLPTAEVYTRAAVIISPTSGIPGQVVTVAGGNFYAGEPIQLYSDVTSTTPLTSTTSSASGIFLSRIMVPSAPYGAHSLIVVGQNSGAVVSIPFQVKPLLVPAPASGPAGSPVMLTGAGFGAQEPITVVWDSPLQILGATTSDVGGSFAGANAITVTVPLSATGQHIIYAVGGSSRAITGARFTVH